MKAKVLYFLGLISTCMIWSGGVEAQYWVKELSGSDTVGTFSKVKVHTDTAGNRYLAGVFMGMPDFDPGSGVHNLKSTAYWSAFIAKYNASGALVFARGIDGFGQADVGGITLDNNNNILVTGTFGGTLDFDIGPGVALLSAGVGPAQATYTSIYLAKYTSDGDYIYAKEIRTKDSRPSNSFVSGIGADEQGNVYISGRFSDTVDFDPGAGQAYLENPTGVYGMFYAKYDTAGSYIYAKQIGSSTSANAIYPQHMSVDKTGNMYITGQLSGTLPVDFDPGTGTADLISNGQSDIFVAKYNSIGNYVYAHAVGGTRTDIGYAITSDKDGNAYLTGTFSDTVDFDPGTGVDKLVSGTIPTDQGIFFAKYGPSGNFLFAKNIGNSSGYQGTDIGTHIVVDDAGNIYLTGFIGNPADFAPGVSVGTAGNNIFYAKYDPSGNYVLAQALSISSNPSQEQKYIGFDAAGNLYISGIFSREIDFDPGAGTANLISGSVSTDNVDGIYLAKYDAGGDYLNARRLGGYPPTNTVFSGASFIRKDISGNIYVVANYAGDIDFDTGPGVAILNGSGTVLAKYDGAGNYLYAKTLLTGQTWISDVVIGDTGNVFIAGAFQNTLSFDMGTGTASLASKGNKDAFFAKYDSLGNYIWSKGLGGSREDGYSNNRGDVKMVIDPSGAIFLTGTFAGSADFDPGTATVNLIALPNGSTYTKDVFFAKYNDQGEYIFAHKLGSRLNEFAHSIVLDGANNVYLCGTFAGAVDFDPGTGTTELTPVASNEVFIAKYSASGSYMNVSQLDLFRNGTRYGLLSDKKQYVYLTSDFAGTKDFDPGPGTAELISNGGRVDLFCAKYDTAGNYVSAWNMGGPRDQNFRSSAVDHQGNVYLAGEFIGSVTLGTEGEILAKSVQSLDAFYACYDSSGAYISGAYLGGMAGINDIITDDSGYALIAGAYSYMMDYNGDTILAASGTRGIFSKYNMAACTPPAAAILYNGSLSFCQGDSVALYASAGSNQTYRWLKNNAVLNAATDSMFVAWSDGSYNVIISNRYRCADTSDPVTVTELPVPVPVITESGGILSTGAFDTYQWYINNTLIPGATSQTYMPIIGGNYTVAVTDGNDCAGTSVIFPYLNTDNVEETGVISRQVKVYPNPAHEVVHITAPIALSAVITSIEGKVVLQSGVTTAIDVSSLSNGIYILQLTDESGRVIKTEKLSKTGND